MMRACLNSAILTLSLSGLATASLRGSASTTVSDVSAAFGAASGVKVTQITSGPRGNMLSYYDINCYSPILARLIYNSTATPEPKAGKKGPVTWDVVSVNPDGSAMEVLNTRLSPSISVDRADLSADGKFVSYVRNNSAPDTGWDVYGFFVTAIGRGEELRITHRSYPVHLTPKIKTSPATLDPRSGKYLLAYSIDHTLHLVWHDGTAPNGAREPQALRLDDLESGASFHRVRLNPRFSSLIMYRRNPPNDKATDGASKNIWVVDWTKPPLTSVQWHDQAKGPHMLWTPDGQHVAVDRVWTEYHLADAEGKLLPGLNPRTVAAREIGPFGKGDPRYAPVFYGSYSPDGTLLAIATRPDSDEGGKIWLMDRVTGQVRYLARALSFGPVTSGQPRLGFFAGNTGIAFSTDRSWGAQSSAPAQVYTITGFAAP